MPPQLIFNLPLRTARGRGDYFISPANELALRTLDATAGWAGGKMLLIGPEGSGKTHLAHIWAEGSGAHIHAAADLPDEPEGPVAVEDIDAIAGNASAETRLFHLHNLAQAGGRALLLTSALPPAAMPWALPDLKSRLLATTTTALLPPDDALLAQVLVKLFADRQLTVSPTLIPYLVSRMDRSLSAAARLVGALDARALASSRPVTRALAAEVLDIAAPNAP
jgi:chromosomal replication initiation ATPase DnaA